MKLVAKWVYVLFENRRKKISSLRGRLKDTNKIILDTSDRDQMGKTYFHRRLDLY